MSRRSTKFEHVRKYVVPTALCMATIAVLVLVPPYNVYIIVAFIALVTCAVGAVTRQVAPGRDSTLAALFVVAFLSMNALVGFNLTNTILLLSFIIGVRLLLQ